MNLLGLTTVTSDQTKLIDELAIMMGTSFLEELWTMELLSCLDGPGDDARKLEISQAIMRENFTLGAPFQSCYTLDDRSACAGGYLKSELGTHVWDDIETASMQNLKSNLLTSDEADRINVQMKRMEHITVFDWEEGEAQTLGASDFIHFYALGVDRRHRGSGAFRRLITPFLSFADKKKIPCFLETYSDRLEELYAHFGFKTIHVYRDPAFSIIERCMVRMSR